MKTLQNEILSGGLIRDRVGMLCEMLTGGSEKTYPHVDAGEWDGLVSAADREGVAPLLRHRLEKRGWLESLPDGASRALNRAYFSSAANNLLLLGELSNLLDTTGPFGNEEAIVLKGADLALSLYPGMALRPMCDLDLLSPRKRIDDHLKRLYELGYQRAQPDLATGHNRLTGHAVCLTGGPSDCVAVELHWQLVGGDHDWRAPEADWFWEQTETWNRCEPGSSGAADREALSRLPSALTHLKPSAHLLYLAAHLMFQHGGAGQRLIWIYDLHLLVKRCGDRLDWEEIRRRAREFRWSASVVLALQQAQECFHTPLPEGFLDAVASDRDGRSVGLLDRGSESLRPRGERAWDELMCLSWPARLRFTWNHFFPSASYVRWRYKPRPGWIWPLCYPYRWGVIASEGLTALGKRLRWSRAQAGSS